VNITRHHRKCKLAARDFTPLFAVEGTLWLD
jgi:hypothetical protein